MTLPSNPTNAGQPPLTQIEAERQESLRQAQRRAARLGMAKPANCTLDIAALFPSKRIETGLEAAAEEPPVAVVWARADHSPDARAQTAIGATDSNPFTTDEAVDIGTTGAVAASAARSPPLNGDQGTPSGIGLPAVDHGEAIRFYEAVQPYAFVLGYRQGRSISSAGEFRALAQEADSKHENLFFHVATLKAEWCDPSTHEKGKVTTASRDKAVNMPDGSTSHVRECPYLWGDCDAEKYAGADPVEAAQHYAREGVRVRSAIAEGLNRLGITPYALWRSGAGWQFLIKLDRAAQPEEAETLVGKLHTALGFDPVVRNCNRILRVPGSVNWKNGVNGRVPSSCVPLFITNAVTEIDDVRKALAEHSCARAGNYDLCCDRNHRSTGPKSTSPDG